MQLLQESVLSSEDLAYCHIEWWSRMGTPEVTWPLNTCGMHTFHCGTQPLPLRWCELGPPAQGLDTRQIQVKPLLLAAFKKFKWTSSNLEPSACTDQVQLQVSSLRDRITSSQHLHRPYLCWSQPWLERGLSQLWWVNLQNGKTNKLLLNEYSLLDIQSCSKRKVGMMKGNK